MENLSPGQKSGLMDFHHFPETETHLKRYSQLQNPLPKSGFYKIQGRVVKIPPNFEEKKENRPRLRGLEEVWIYAKSGISQRVKVLIGGSGLLQ